MDGCRSVWRPLWGLGEKGRGSSGVPHSGRGGDAEHGNKLGCLFILNPIGAKSGETGHKEPAVGTLDFLQRETDIDEPMSVSRPLNTHYLFSPHGYLGNWVLIFPWLTGKLKA